MIPPLYRAQVELLIRILPEIGREAAFAVKGGTAINLFVHEMPRLSIDIDLTYLPLDDRQTALPAIAEALQRIQERLRERIPAIGVQSHGGRNELRLVCRSGKATFKVEVNGVLRGHLWPVRTLPLAAAAQDEFGMFAEATVLSHQELFGGKICAALDRQHPRDLFDVRQLLEHGGVTDAVRAGMIASLAIRVPCTICFAPIGRINAAPSRISLLAWR